MANESGATNEPSESDRSITDALIRNAQAAYGTNPNVPTSPKKFAMWFSRVACFVADAAILLALIMLGSVLGRPRHSPDSLTDSTVPTSLLVP